MTIGDRLKKLRMGKKLTQRKLADNVNFSHSYIGDIEKNRTVPSIETLQKLAFYFEVDIAYFVSTNSCCFVRKQQGEVPSCYMMDEACRACPLKES